VVHYESWLEKNWTTNGSTDKSKDRMTKQTLDVFQVVANAERRQILEMLSNESLTINALAENFDISRPAVSKHIKALSDAGFVSIQDIGRERFCTLKQEGFVELQGWIDYFDIFWKSRLRNLQKLLDNKTRKR
jgi:DNA-binding transcriptional ArsR family regulator